MGAGRRVCGHGYVSVQMLGHPRATEGYVLEHILVAERAIGHHLQPPVVIHHVNELVTDNNPTNLVICEDQAYHMLLHVRARVLRAGGDPRSQRICGGCKELGPQEEIGRRGHCRECHNAANRKYRATRRRG